MVAVGAVVLAIGGLYLGKEFFVPFSLAMLVAFALSPIVNWLRRWRLPRILAVLSSVAVAAIIVGGLSYVVATQLLKLASAIPAYQETMIEKVRLLQLSGKSGGLIDRVTHTFDELGKELAKPDASSSTTQDQVDQIQQRQPIPVTIQAGAQSPIDVLRSVLGPLIEPLATIGIVIVLVIFVLLQRDDLRDRFIKVVGSGDLQTSTEALKEAGSRVSRYLLMQLTVNVLYGVPIGIGLYFIGVPNAILWGVLATVLRFIPYLGPALAAVFPIALAFIVDPGWSMLFLVVALFLGMELLSNNVVEPLLYGTSTGLSALAIISAAIFWTMLWGPIGLVLSTPLTVCLVVIGRYVPQLNFLGVLLGSEPVLTLEQRLYQRLLAGNHEAAVELAERYISEHDFQAFLDDLAIPALRFAENDRQRNAMGGTYKATVAEGMTALIRDVSVPNTSPSTDVATTRTPRALGAPSLCIGGKTYIDLAAAEIVARAASTRGIESQIVAPLAVSQNGIRQLDLAGVEVVCVSYFDPNPEVYAKFVSGRIKRRSPSTKIIVCLWNHSFSPARTVELESELGVDAVVGTVAEATAQIDRWVAQHLSDPMEPAPLPVNESDRLEALKSLGFISGDSRHFDDVARKVAAAFGTPIALVTMVDEKHQIWPGASGLPPKLDACRMSARDTSICGHVVASDTMFVIEDVAKDSRFANNPFVIENGIRFYAGAPLRTVAGYPVGSLCVIDTKPRSFDLQDREALDRIAKDLMVKVELECQRNRALSALGLPLDTTDLQRNPSGIDDYVSSG